MADFVESEKFVVGGFWAKNDDVWRAKGEARAALENEIWKISDNLLEGGGEGIKGRFAHTWCDFNMR